MVLAKFLCQAMCFLYSRIKLLELLANNLIIMRNVVDRRNFVT